MARTMTDEQERDIRRLVDLFDETPSDSNEAALLSELDAERAAHGETIASLNQERSAHEETKDEVGRLMVALHGDGSSVPGAEDEIAAIKARLALAEALDTAVANFLSPQRLGCTLEELREGVVQMAHTQPDARSAADALALIDALAAWRAAK